MKYIIFSILFYIILDNVSFMISTNRDVIHNSINNFKYSVKRRIRRITYIFRHPYYKHRLYKRLKRCFYDPWEVVELLLHMNFELLSEFYIYGGIEYIEWDATEDHKHARKEMEELYIWWNCDRVRKRKELEEILNAWSEHYLVRWEKIDSKFLTYHTIETKYAKYLSYLYSTKEMELKKEEEENLIRLMKIKDYLWT